MTLDCFCAICHEVIMPHEEVMRDKNRDTVHFDCWDGAMAQAELIERSDWSEDFWGAP